MGLGRQLMRRLVRWAKGRKLERLCGDVLEHNQPMLALAQSLGFRREPTEQPGLVRVVLDLTGHVPIPRSASAGLTPTAGPSRPISCRPPLA